MVSFFLMKMVNFCIRKLLQPHWSAYNTKKTTVPQSVVQDLSRILQNNYKNDDTIVRRGCPKFSACIKLEKDTSKKTSFTKHEKT